jgi:membrane fusion protein, multidrug efflux system
MKTINTIFGLAFIFGLISCGGDKQTKLNDLKAEQADLAKQIEALEKEMPEDTISKIKRKDVSVTVLTTRAFDHYVQTQGVVESEENVMVSSKTMGVITKVLVREGEQVKKGQVLGIIDNAITIRSIDELKASLELANTVFERQKNLWDQKIGTEVQFLQAKNNKESLEARLALLNEQLDMSRIKSPINGTVEEVNVKAGENAAPGAPAFRVVNTNSLKIKAKVSEAYVTAIKQGNRVLVTFPDLDKTVEARVTFVGRNIDALSRSFSVEVKLSPSHADLRPNMTAVIRVVFHTSSQALCIPVNVVQDINGEKVVYVAEGDTPSSVARRRKVEVVGVYNNLAEIKTGLKEGDRVITFGYQGLNDGEFIKI